MSPFEALVPIMAIFFVIGLPMIGLVTRFAIRPVIRDLGESVRGHRDEETAELAERLARLEERLEDQDRTLRRLEEAERFRRRLEDAGPRSTSDDGRATGPLRA